MVEKKLSIKRRRNCKIGLIILAIIILCVGGGVAFALLTHKADTSSEDEIVAPAETEESPARDTEKDTETDNFNEVPQYEGESPNTLHELTGVINYSAVAGDNYSIRISIDQTLGSGTCKLTMSSDAKTYTAEAPVIQSGSTTSSCEGFDIPLSELSASKKWNISIAISSGDKSGLIVGEASL